jgi:uncharacterized peroxidase-related enzyme
MNRITPLDQTEAPEESNEILTVVNRASGMIPNVLKVLATSPPALHAWWNFKRAIGASKLPPTVHEQLAVLTAAHNGCAYCLSAHSAAARRLGLSVDEIEAAQRGEATDPLAATVLAFGAAVLAHRGDVPDDALDAARRAGLDDADLIDVVAFVVISTFTNYLNRLAHTELDFPEAHLRQAS